MITVTEDLLNAIIELIVRAVDPEMVILFGSHAQSLEGADSDIDLIIIERESFGPARSRRKESLKIRRALSAFGIAKDILVYSEQEVDEWRNSPDHILTDALHNGRCLYVRP